MIAREQFVAAVSALVGCKVAHRGRDPRFGLDCAGVAVAAMAACGLVVDDLPTYGTLPSADQLAGMLVRYCDRIDTADRAPGDLLQVRFGHEARHLVVMVSEDTCVEAIGKFGEVREIRLRPQRIHSVWRLRGVG